MKRVLGVADMQQIEYEIVQEIDRIAQRHGLYYCLSNGSVLGAIRHQGPIPWDYDMDIVVPMSQLEEFVSCLKRELPQSYLVIDCDSTPGYGRLVPRVSIDVGASRYLHVDIFPLVGLPDEPKAQRRASRRFDRLNRMYRYKQRPLSMVPAGVMHRALWAGRKLLLWPVTLGTIRRAFERMCTRHPFEDARYVMNPCGFYGVKNILPKAVFGTPVRVRYLEAMLPVPERYEEYLRHYYKDYMKYPSQEAQEAGLKFTVEIGE